MSKKTSGLTGADIESICKRASILAIREFVGMQRLAPTATDFKKFKITARHFEEAMKTAKRSAPLTS